MKKLAATILLAVLSFTLPQAKATQLPPPANSANACVPSAVVASFLGFTEPQLIQFQGLLGPFVTTVGGLQQQIAARQTQLNILLSQPNPNPAALGTLVLQIHALEQQLAHTIEAFQTQFAALLTEEQKQKLQAVTLASGLQPVVGAFVALRLAPAPAPLPCEQQ